MSVADNISFLVAYGELFARMLEDMNEENNGVYRNRWRELSDSIKDSIRDSGVTPSFWAVAVRLGLDEAEYLAVVLAAAREMGILNKEDLRFMHAATLYSRVCGGNALLSGLYFQSGLFSLLWRERAETILLSRPLILRADIAKYIIAEEFFDTDERSWHPPLNNGASREGENGGGKCSCLKKLLEDGIAAVGGSSEERLALVKEYGERYSTAVYACVAEEPEIADCVLCAAASGSLLYLASLKEESLWSLRFWQREAGIPIIAGVDGESFPGLPFLPAGERKEASLTAIYGDSLREQLALLSEYIRRGGEAFERYGLMGIQNGGGICALFHGKSGTGKTMAAKALSVSLGRPLLTVSLAEVFDKYIGETEKQIERFFNEAAKRKSVLFFDEAEALFTKRTEVSGSHDKYANLSSSYLLKKIEQFTGVVVLSTNLAQNIDNAFIRRIQFVIRFPMPDRSTRKLYWSDHLKDIDDEFLNELSDENLSLARIKEIIKMSAVLAFYKGHNHISKDDVREALHMETEKDSGCAL